VSTSEWTEVFEQKFCDREAREASDFSEILSNYGLEPTDAFKMMCDQDLTVGQRLYFVVNASEDDVALMLLREQDGRLIEAMKRRLADARIKQDGGIVC